MDISDKNLKAMSDMAILKFLGDFVRQHRLEQNKTQGQLAKEAGINRTTLSEFEHGKRSNTLTFIQLLRALNKFHVLEQFKIEKKLSPIQMAKLEQAQRKRASGNKRNNTRKKSDW